MQMSTKSLALLALSCAFAGTVFGLGSAIFSFSSIYEDTGRAQFFQLASTVVYLTLAILLVLNGGWRGVLAATLMVLGATAAVWALLPLALVWASVSDPAGYAERFGDMRRPPYLDWALWDVLGVTLAAFLAQGLRRAADLNPKRPPDG
jgi:hypothetical protein